MKKSKACWKPGSYMYMSSIYKYTRIIDIYELKLEMAHSHAKNTEIVVKHVENSSHTCTCPISTNIPSGSISMAQDSKWSHHMPVRSQIATLWASVDSASISTAVNIYVRYLWKNDAVKYLWSRTACKALTCLYRVIQTQSGSIAMSDIYGRQYLCPRSMDSGPLECLWGRIIFKAFTSNYRNIPTPSASISMALIVYVRYLWKMIHSHIYHLGKHQEHSHAISESISLPQAWYLWQSVYVRYQLKIALSDVCDLEQYGKHSHAFTVNRVICAWRPDQ